MEAGALVYHTTDEAVADVLATCEALTAPQRLAKRIALHLDGCSAGLRVHADRDKLQQILLNLMSNAVKFTEPDGRITVRCAAAGDTIGVSIGDTGRGIPAHDIERIFEPFVQVDARYKRVKEGVGLGLAISRDLARGMGGDLSVVSTVGVGSTFTLTLPRSS
jgi:signal transduction histidine kinase